MKLRISPPARHTKIAPEAIALSPLALAAALALMAPVPTAQAQLSTAEARLALVRQSQVLVNTAAAVLAARAIDRDADGTLEPPAMRDAWVPATSTLGLLPLNAGLPQFDAWGSPLGYCAWDHGGTTSGANLVPGTPAGGRLLAVLSAGPNRTFDTTCAQLAVGLGGGDDYVSLRGTAQTVLNAGLSLTRPAVADEAALLALVNDAGRTAAVRNTPDDPLLNGELRITTADNAIWRFNATHTVGTESPPQGRFERVSATIATGSGGSSLIDGDLTVNGNLRVKGTSALDSAVTIGLTGLGSTASTQAAGLTIAGSGGLSVAGTPGDPGTSNLTLGALGGPVHTGTLDPAFDRVVVANASGQLAQTSFAAIVAGGVSTNAWALIGNAGTNPVTNFLGTTDNQPLVVKTNGIEALRIAAGAPSAPGTATFAGAVSVGSGGLSVGGTAGTWNSVLASLGGTPSTAVNLANYNRIVLADADGRLAQVATGALLADQSWLLTGNALTVSGGTLGQSPAVGGNFIGTTGVGAAARDLSFVTGNVIRAQISATGSFSAAQDIIVNGVRVGKGNGSGSQNTALGASALPVTTGNMNTALGFQALQANTSGYSNTVVGAQALASNTVGYSNTVSGNMALLYNTAGSSNTASGYEAMKLSETGNNNTATGLQSMFRMASGNRNTAYGMYSLRDNTSGSDNVALGYSAGYNETGSNKLYIANSQTNNLIYGDFSTGRTTINAGATPAAPGAALQVNTPDAATLGLIVRGTSSHTANLFEAQSWNGTTATQRAAITSDGRFALNAPTPAGTVHVVSVSQTNPVLIVGGVSGHTGNLLQLRSGEGRVVLSASATGALSLNPFGTIAGNTNELRFAELAANGTNYVGFKAADALGANVVWTLPSADGANGQVLGTDGSGVLSWTTVNTADTAWQLLGNAGTTNGGTLGSAPIGSFVGTTGAGADARDLSFATANVIRAQISTAGQLSTQQDIVVNGITVGRGAGNFATNLVVGNSVLAANTTGNYNVAIGANDGGAFRTMGFNTTGSRNLGIGVGALSSNTTGNDNVALGSQALAWAVGSDNIAIGPLAGACKFSLAPGCSTHSDATSSIFIGARTRSLDLAATNQIVIGTDATGLGSNSIVLGNTAIATTLLRGNVLARGANGQATALFEAQTWNGTTATTVASFGPTGALTLNPFGTSAGNTNELRFAELAANGTNYVGFKAADALAANVVWTLPSADGTNGQVLSTDGAGMLSWSTVNTANTAWQLLGNAGTTNGGTLGSAPTGNFVGTTGTGADARDLSFVTHNVIRAQISADGVLSTQRDIVVNGVTVGRGNGSGVYATAVGRWALSSITASDPNTAIGAQAMQNTTAAIGTTAVGASALQGVNGNYNLAVGGEAGLWFGPGTSNTLSAASNSVFLGARTRAAGDAQSNQIVIGADALGLGSNSASLGNTDITLTQLRGRVAVGSGSTAVSGAAGVNGLIITAGASQLTNNLFEARNNAGTALASISSTGLGTFAGLLVNGTAGTPNATIASLGGTASTSTNLTTYDRLVVASDTGLLSQVSTGAIVAANAWALGGNSYTNSGGALGAAPTGTFIGSTNTYSSIQDNGIRFATDNVVRAIISRDGVLSTQKDIIVSGITVGVGRESDTSNVAVGLGALAANTLLNVTGGRTNTAIGSQALAANTTGFSNTAVGAGTMRLSTTAYGNTALGTNSMEAATTGMGNTALGLRALKSLTGGSSNVAVGFDAGQAVTTGNLNVMLGFRAGWYETGSNKLYIAQAVDNPVPNDPPIPRNLIYGDFAAGLVSINAGATPATPAGALQVNSGANATVGLVVRGNSSDGSTSTQTADLLRVQTWNGTAASTHLTVNGTGALATTRDITVNGVTVGKGGGSAATNTVLGVSALAAATTVAQSVAIGNEAARFTTDGERVTAVGFRALYNNTSGFDNTAVGFQALTNLSSGSYNIALGGQAGRLAGTGAGVVSNATSNRSIYVGWDTRAAGSGQTNQIVIGDAAVGLGSNSVMLGNADITRTRLTGRVGIGADPTTAAGDAQLQVIAAADTNRGLVIGGFSATQSASLFEARSSAGTPLASIGATGAFTLHAFGTAAGNTNELRFAELAANGGNYVGFKAADAIAGNIIWTLPAADGAANQVLATNGAGVLSWVAPSSAANAWQLSGNTGTNPLANFLGTTDAQPLVVRTNGTERLRVLATGNVGVGTATPTQRLEVNGNIALTSGGGQTITTDADAMTLQATGGTYGTVRLKLESVGGSYGAIFQTVSNAAFPNTNMVDFGFVPGNGRQGNLRLEARLADLRNAANATNGEFQFFLNSTVAAVTSLYTGSAVTGIASGNFVVHSGDVGIGTVSPAARLDVSGSLRASGAVTLGGIAATATAGDDVLVINASNQVQRITRGTLLGTSTAWSLTGNAATSVATNFLGTTDAQPLAVRTSNAERIRVTATGDVGIGTTAPQARLDVQGSNDAIRALAGSIGVPIALAIGRSAVDARVGIAGTAGQYSTDSAAGDLVIRTEASGQRLLLNTGTAGAGLVVNNSNVGIGTASPATRLDVNGTLRASGAVTLTSLGGTAATTVPSGYDRIVLANSTGQLEEASISTLLGSGSGTGWALAGNSYTNSAGALGLAPSGTFLGSTNNAAGNELRLVTSNVVRAVISQVGQMSTQLDMVVNGATLGRGGSSVASNTTLGFEGLLVNTSGTNNAAFGNQTLKANTTGTQNTAVGSQALMANVSGQYNTAVGFAALTAATASGNTAVGFRAMQSTTTGANNVGFGYDALKATTTGIQNTALGHSALVGNIGGSGNVALGYFAGGGAGEVNNRLFVANSSSTTLLFGEFDTGRLMVNTTGSPGALTAALQVNIRNNTDDGLVIRMANAQQNTSFPFEIQNLAGVAIASIDTSGDALLGGVRVGRGGSYVATNTTVGFETLLSNTSGSNNTAHGFQALRANTTGIQNTAIGSTALAANVSGQYNTAVGFAALAAATASGNTALGFRAMQSTTTGANSVALGYDALRATTTGIQNTAVGYSALSGNTIGGGNVALGHGAGGGAGAVDNRLFIANSNSTTLLYGEFDTGRAMINTTGAPPALTAALQVNIRSNADDGLVIRMATGQQVTTFPFEIQNSAGTAIASVDPSGDAFLGGVRVGRGGSYVATNTTVGFETLLSNTNGSNNTALGYQALKVNTTGTQNTAIGSTALAANVTGQYNTAVGVLALTAATVSGNTAVGFRAMQFTTTGANNVAFGYDALKATTTGYQNTAIGHTALGFNTTGFGNVALGYGAGAGAGATNNRLFIANSSGGNLIYGEFDTGRVMINAAAGPAALTAALQVNVQAAADKGLVVRAASSQTGNLFEVQNITGLPLLQVASDGRMGIGTAPGAGFSLDVNGSIRGTNVYAGATLLTSDARFKTNVQPVLDALAVVQRLQGVSFDWNRAAFPERNFSVKPQLGVIAQQVESVLPQLVDTDALGYKSVNYTGFIPLLIEGMKAQQGQIVAAQATLEKHGQRLEAAEKKLGALDERTGKIELRMGQADEAIARLTERADGMDAFTARFDASTEGTLAVRTPTFQVNNLTAERAVVEELIAKRLEAEQAKFKTIEAEEGRMNGNLQARSVSAQRVASGGKELFVSLGSIAPLFEVPEGAHFVVTLTSSDGSYASATVVRAGGQLRVMPSASDGIDLVAQGTQVGVVAASKKVKASWLRTG